MKHFDFIIAGGGVSGLSLAYHLANSPLRDRSILIIDKNQKTQNDCTLSFWANDLTTFDNIVYCSWQQLRFVGDNFVQDINLQNYRYQMIRGIDFYRFVQQTLSRYPNVQFLPGTVNYIDDGNEQAIVYANGQAYSGTWVFDSRFRLSELKANSARYHWLNLHFKGWEIETPQNAFNPQLATFMDFRTPQKQDTRFFYVLPFSQHRALVEYSLFTKGPINQNECKHALQAYIENTLGIKEYRILNREGGLIPSTDYTFPRQIGRRIMAIGTLGGQVKPSTGYAFERIQQDSINIVRSLSQTGHPFDIPTNSGFYRLCDSLMLDVMEHHGEQLKPIFTALFKNNSIKRIFSFLDEAASLRENLLLMASLPPRLFLQALFESKVFGRMVRQSRHYLRHTLRLPLPT
jgi:lycopene beta-cyclase